MRGCPDKVQCTVCSSTFGIAYQQGKHDIEHHLDFEGREHKRLAKVINSCQSLASFLPDRSSSQMKVTVLFTGFIICLFKQQLMLIPPLMFPDSGIAKKYV